MKMIGYMSVMVALLSVALWLALFGVGDWCKMSSLSWNNWAMFSDLLKGTNATERSDVKQYDIVEVYKMGIIKDASDENIHIQGCWCL